MRIILLTSLLCVSLLQNTRSQITDVAKLCEEATIATCDQCIQKHPECVWCAASSQPSVTIQRCMHQSKKKQCPSFLEEPIGKIDRFNNTPLSEINVTNSPASAVQLQPQAIRIKLRKGETKKFNVTFRKVTDYPVDLYYLMDLSNSMADDLQTLQKLGKTLAEDIKNNVTNNIQMGFGTFVDKVMMPFASTVPEQLVNPCAKNKDAMTCAPPFGFRHQQQISENLTSFKDSVQNTNISGNIDSPEGSFDALMQIAVCQTQIGWRPEATHLVVVTTDASFHMALDGKLAAILEANDMKCHLKKGANIYLPKDVVYSKSQELDYPSIGQLRSAFQSSKIQPIFAVTSGVRSLYDGLQALIPNSYVATLATDSGNIIDIIKTAYNKLKEKLEMTLGDQKPAEIDIKLRVLCPNSTGWQSSLTCNQIKIGSEVVYEFEVTATGCPPSGAISQPVIFTSNSLQEDVKLYFDVLCSCSCSSTLQPNSVNCSTNGTLICGVCDCGTTHEGATCQCLREKADVSLLGKCRLTPTADLCQGKGKCECGTCICNSGFKGKHCECSNTGCPSNEDGECGGPANGICENCNNNPNCSCIPPWTKDPNIGTCTCNRELCKEHGNKDVVCNNRGMCDCAGCICHNESKIYTGKYCETCVDPSCKNNTLADCGPERSLCAKCANNAQRVHEIPSEKCATECAGMDFKLVDSIPDCTTCGSNCPSLCSKIDIKKVPQTLCEQTDQCNIVHQVAWSTITNNYWLLIKKYDRLKDCPQPINVLLIVLPIVVGIVVLGLIALIAWKIYQTIRDKREWVNFENEMKKSKWTKGQNPIFEKPSSRFENPTFQGN